MSIDSFPLDKVAVRTSEVDRLTPDWCLTYDLLGGTKAMRAAGKRHLPKFVKEKPETYQRRLMVSTLFPAFSQTVRNLVGKPFSRPITVNEDVPPGVKELLTDIDKEGRNLETFSADLLKTCLGPGMCGILVDFPKAPTTTEGALVWRTQAQEAALKIRPYFTKIDPTNLVGWRFKIVDGKGVLLQLRYKEFVNEPDGLFGTKSVEQIKVWNLTTWEVYRQDENRHWQLFDNGVNTLGEIPYAPCYGEYQYFMVGTSPLIELAYLNVKHWQSQSDQDNLLKVARVPILTVQTDDKTFEFELGSQTALRLPIGEAKMAFVEHTGKAIEAGKVSLDDLKDEMRQAGADLLVFRDVQVTATEVATDSSVGMCDLQRITSMLEDSINLALSFVGKWLRLDTGGTVTLFKEFGFSTIGEASAAIVLEMNAKEIISDETALSEIQRRGIVSPSVNVKDEQTKIASQPEKKKDKLAREQAEAKANQQQQPNPAQK